MRPAPAARRTTRTAGRRRGGGRLAPPPRRSEGSEDVQSRPAWRRRERDDDRVARLRPEARLHLRDRAERRQHLGERYARGRPPSPASASAAERGERALMDRAVLADLERREVEPERRHLPAQLGDLAPGDPLEAVVDERRLDLGSSASSASASA